MSETRSARRFAISLDWAHKVALGFVAAGKDAAEFGAFVAANYSGLSAQRLRNAWLRVATQ